MQQVSISVDVRSVLPGEAIGLECAHAAIFVLEGKIEHAGAIASAGSGTYLEHGSQIRATDCAAKFVQFGLDGPGAETSGQPRESFNVVAPRVVFRLDQISFPKGAIAYRHIHAGTGYRYLVKGTLEIQTDDHAFTVAQGDSWFEPANSAVHATNLSSSETAFVRAMILPLEYLGKPTIQYLNAEDADKPRLQSNHRFFDQVIDLSGG